uniref:Methyltransferase type 11 domain-containing protein n=1 Tax=Pseudo-nitzschia australis TaxID=44445 RepID=A0A7S4ER94_9STRA|mmetsp:Transcript_9599/g.20777  ORF Transcript_9599/g.20777 Transcript_9599/m.20777 type:complete len:461 (+) Transcript_9599:147-1529(+)|eukprot:CAMPEP_0168176500 /NCGR_PEP_ID=MMETSP0139_2-20121125/7828_1 /TAXON_ID=44445 /ORGANISM="Pseudo-nitzschia australis, Strain 10249 10 AB" /LENGTH=460 /DNA_ID=CAMNT_0008095237 /DNA_START=44 /DNA_END=1426 /DNA_ORIENTATION=-
MTTGNSAGSPDQRKRPRVEAVEVAEDTQDASETGTGTKEKPTPAYGSQEYWEDRYKNMPSDQDPTGQDDPQPYHAWYFKFEDLAPLLMPLILGDDDNNDDDDIIDDKKEANGIDGLEGETAPNDKSDCENEAVKLDKKKENGIDNFEGETVPNDKSDCENEAVTLDKDQNELSSRQTNDEEHKSHDSDSEQVENGNNNTNDSGDESDDFEVIEMDDDDDDEDPVVRVGLAKDGPISVLEVGCGDAPLGRDLALSIQDYGITVGQDPSSIIQKVVCIDYSKNVIGTMQEEQQKNQLQSGAKQKGLPVHYEVADARQLSYENESFEMILEKGTLDAMLSDSDGGGQENCRKIVSECARVLKVGGYIIIISHLNARVESGLQWLNDVIVPGVRAAGKYQWLVEVHGSDVEIPSDDDDDTEEKCVESPGPAVYFIEKVGISPTTKDSDGSEHSPPNIPLKFFSY